MIRLIVLLALGLATGASLAVASDSGTASTDAVRTLLGNQRDAWNRGDLDAFMKDYWHGDALRFASGDAVRTGWQATIDRYRRTYPDPAAMGKLDFDLIEVRELAPTVVYGFGKWRLTRTGEATNKAPHGLFTLIVEKKDGAWVITRDHTSAAAD